MPSSYSSIIEESTLIKKFAIVRYFPPELNLPPEMVIDPVPWDYAKFHRLVNSRGGEFWKVPMEEPTGMVDCGNVKILPGVIETQPEPATPANEGFVWMDRLSMWELDGNRYVRRQTWELVDTTDDEEGEDNAG